MTKHLEKRNGRRSASKDIIVLYHAECTDGFMAAWAAWRKFGDSAEYIAVEHQVPPPEGLQDKIIYTLDFTYAAPVMAELKAANKKITSIDHHVTAKDVTLSTEGGVYDVDHSGAVLAWNYFHPGEPVPFLVRVVEDMDLYRFALPETKPLSYWLDTFHFSFQAYSEAVDRLQTPDGLRKSLEDGELVKRYSETLVERLVHNSSYEVELDGYKVLAVTTELFHNEVGNALAIGRPFGVAWRIRRNGAYVSLRSDNDGVDVGQVAARHGGGGHKHSAGFLVPDMRDLPFKTTK